jgi:hypothetical protein
LLTKGKIIRALSCGTPASAFTKFGDASRIEGRLARFRGIFFATAKAAAKAHCLPEADQNTGALMLASGELIRSMNYVEDITTTLRRICISIPAMSVEERKRLADSLRTAGVALNDAIKDLEKEKVVAQ